MAVEEEVVEEEVVEEVEAEEAEAEEAEAEEEAEEEVEVEVAEDSALLLEARREVDRLRATMAALVPAVEVEAVVQVLSRQ